MITTPRLQLEVPQSTDNVSGYPADAAQSLGALDNAALYKSGTITARASVTPLVAGLVYRATDTGDISIYDGSAWRSLVRASEAVAIVRGYLDGRAGSFGVSSGTGFSASRTGTGRYTITFATAFNTLPVVTITTNGVSGLTVGLFGTINTSSMTVVIDAASSSIAQDDLFSFIAIG